MKITIDCDNKTISWDYMGGIRKIPIDSSDPQGAIATVCVLMGIKDRMDCDGLMDRMENFVF